MCGPFHTWRRKGRPAARITGNRFPNYGETITRITGKPPWWSWGESNPRPLGGYRTRYDHSCTAASMATALAGQRTSRGGHHQVFPRCQCSFTRSVVFPYGPSTLLLPGCMDQAPCAVTGHDDSLQPGLNQAARANCSLAVHFVPPFNESVATRVANSTSRSQRRNQSAPLHCCTAVLLYCCTTT